MDRAPALGADAGTFRSPRETAELLSVSPSGLRRLAEIYSAVCGELPRDPKTRGRLWPEEAVGELLAARRLVLANRASSIREALEAIRRGEAESAELDGVESPSGSLAGRVDGLADEVRELRRELATVGGLLAEIRGDVAELAQRLDRLPAVVADRRPGAGESELHELRRRLRYLQAELEVREI
jgi:hypothetical protein